MGLAMAKNSKGLLINKIIDLRAHSASIIISLCFKPVGRASDVKKTMVEEITQVYKNMERFNWAEHLADMIRTNCKEVQDSGRAIKFTSLLIWIEMEQYGLVGEEAFTTKKVLTMEKYRVFSSNQIGMSNSLPPQEIFRLPAQI